MKAVIYRDGTATAEEYDGTLGDMMAQCYARIAEGKDTAVRIPPALGPMFDRLEEALQIRIAREYADISVPPMPTHGGAVLVAYSSGLDSTSHALHLRAQGREVVLFHVKNLNRAYPDEARYAQAFAEHYGIPLVMIEPAWIGQRGAYVDNPIKNQTILAHMLDYGRSIGCTEYAMGNYPTDKLMEQIQGYWTSDSVELYEAFNACMQVLLPGYQYHYMPFDKYGAFEFITREEPEAWAYINSCIRPHRFKDYTHDQTVKKYGVQLIPHHCGVCYKCVLEYLMLTDLGYYQLNTAYAKKCINTLREQDGTTYTMGIRKCMSDAEVLRKALGRDINGARWHSVIDRIARRK